MELFLICVSFLALTAGNARSEKPQTPAELENEYRTLAVEADRLAAAGDNQGAINVIQKLIDNDQLPAKDHAMMTLNKAILFGKMKNTVGAIESFDKAIAFNVPEIKSFLLVNKAVYLNGIGRPQESISIFKSLLKEKNISAQDKEKIKSNIAAIEQSIKK